MAGDVNRSSSPCNPMSFLPGLHVGILLKKWVDQTKEENVARQKLFGCPFVSS